MNRAPGVNWHRQQGFGGGPGPMMEPVRTLDAMHLATMLVFHDVLGSLTVLSFDERIRTNARALGLQVLPAAVGH